MGRSIKHLLVSEHERLHHLFDAMLEAFRANARDDAERLWSEFERTFTEHLAREESYLLPRLRDSHREEADALQAEHDDLRAKLLDLGVGVDLHLTKADAVAAFVAALRAHAQHEEELLYPWAEERAKTFPALVKEIFRSG